MPKPKKESNLEFQKRTFPSRIKAQRRKNKETLGARIGLEQSSTKQRATAINSEKALNKVEKRLGLKSTAVKSKGKPKGKAGAFSKLVKMGKTLSSLPGRGKRNLEEISKKSKR